MAQKPTPPAFALSESADTAPLARGNTTPAFPRLGLWVAIGVAIGAGSGTAIGAGRSAKKKREDPPGPPPRLTVSLKPSNFGRYSHMIRRII